MTGAQWGSEGKGALVAAIAGYYGVHVRVGGPNAGHTLRHKGHLLKLQQLPVGAINQRAECYLGAGAVVSPRILLSEIVTVAAAMDDHPSVLADRVHVDPQAAIVTDWVHAMEGGTGGIGHQQIGSTGEGVGLARSLKMSRNIGASGDGKCVLAGSVGEGSYTIACADGHQLDFSTLVSRRPVRGRIEALARTERVLLEGTQGYGLSLHHGTWPYVTSSDTTAAQLLADVGLGPTSVEDVIVVARTYPIRVAGNSGPMPGEITWDEMSHRLGREVCERTTVTNKVRRVAEWDSQMVRNAASANGATCLALMFLDYIDPTVSGVTSWSLLTPKAKAFVQWVERTTETWVRFVGTGGQNFSVIDLQRPY